MKVTFFGIGYVGLVQASVFADSGHEVVCVDIDDKKIERLNKGIIPIFEPGLSSLVSQNHSSGRLQFSTNFKDAVDHGEFLFIAVGTPPDEDGSADLSHVLSVAKSIALYMQEPKIIINKSTVPVGTADQVLDCIDKVLNKRDININFNVVSNPEFLKEGAAISDCRRPDRIIIGTDNDEVVKKMHELYAPFNRNQNRMIVMDVRSAELTKYAANCMLATKISFMNEMSNIAERLGADIEAVRHGIGSDSRIGYQFIYPGCGYGGSCFPKDVKALIKSTDNIGFNAEILKAVEAVNFRQKEILYKKIYNYFNGDLKGKILALWGLSFKPGTDDMREAPSQIVLDLLLKAGAIVQAFDPEAMQECQRIYGQRNELKLMESKEAALQSANALIIITEWQQFRAPDFKQMKKALSQPVIFDGRNLYDPDKMKEFGFNYYSIGRNKYQ